MPIAHFPDKILEIGQRQAELLVSLKILTPKGNHEFEGADSERALLAMIEHPEVMSCDFCLQEPVVMEYPTRDFLAVETPKEDLGSIGSWMACAICSGYIEQGLIEHLSEHAITQYNERHPVTSVSAQVVTELALRGLHRSFMDNRNGPGKRI